MAFERLAPLPDAAAADRPRVSIVMPTFRRGNVIGRTVESLLAQSFGDFELLVRDDDGEDGTEDVLRAFGDPRIRYHRNPERLRMPGNLNGGVGEARGEFVLICHDHDLYDATLVEKMVGFLDAHPEALFVHTGLLGIDDEERPVREWVGDYAAVTPGPAWIDEMLSRFDCPVCANAMVRRSAHEAHGLYDPDYGFVADVEMWLRLCGQGPVGYLAEPLIQLREREADHEYASLSWELLDLIFRIQRRYHAEVYSGPRRLWRQLGLALRTEVLVLRRYAGCIARRDAEGRSEGRAYLKRSGPLFARAFAHLV